MKRNKMLIEQEISAQKLILEGYPENEEALKELKRLEDELKEQE